MNAIKLFLSSFSDKSRLFFIVFLLFITTLVLSHWLGGLVATAIVIVPGILSILQVTKGRFTPEGGGLSKVGLVSSGIALIAVLSSQQWKPYINNLLEPLFRQLPFLPKNLPSDSPSISFLLLLVFALLLLNYIARDTSAMKKHNTPVEKEFPIKNYSNLLKDFCGVLRDDLNKIDKESNWSVTFYTPLEAEVELQSGTKRLKRVTNLLAAICADRKSRVFLVLGDPGSGKSVALRKLCRDLLHEVENTGKVPLYINLREWEVETAWTEKTPPTIEQLYSFVFNNIKNRGDIFTSEFLDLYFKKMFENGRLFIVLDSFDEIPGVMDVNENSWLIDALSDVIYRFLSGAHESRGILASRIFRRPTDKFDSKTILEIRPFTERKIVESLKKSLSFEENLLKTLFINRQEFIPIARNPFTAALISEYAKKHDNQLPHSQSELYSSYIQYRLNSCEEKIQKNKLTNNTILECAIEIADVMLRTESLGLEASIKVLQENILQYSIENIVNILQYARLGRLGSGEEKRFSFVHRRFNEYFVIKKLLDNPEKVPLSAIPTDSRWRDALVLYCEVADEKYAKNIAEYCWSEIKNITELNMKDFKYLRAVHCLRFLKEAFRTRQECIEPFRKDLSAFIKTQINTSKNLLSQKLAVEAVGLLDKEEMDEILVQALEINNAWIDETALRACRYLPRMSSSLKDRLVLFLESMGHIEIFKRRKELLFSLKLSSTFSGLRIVCIGRIIHIYFLFIGTALTLFVIPSLFFFVLIILLFNSFSFFELPMPVFFRKTTKRKISTLSLLFSKYIQNNLFLSFMPLAVILIIMAPVPVPVHHKQGIILHVVTRANSLTILYVAALLQIPWHLILYYAPSLYKSIVDKSLWSFYLNSILVAFFGLGTGVLFIYLMLNIKIIGFVVSFLATCLILLFVVRYYYGKIKDFFAITKCSMTSNISRKEIAKQFNKFSTPSGRLKYIRLLDTNKIFPSGLWPEGNLPNIDNDAASTMLAKLEEKWLGLDR